MGKSKFEYDLSEETYRNDEYRYEKYTSESQKNIHRQKYKTLKI